MLPRRKNLIGQQEMMPFADDEGSLFLVLLNQEEQYSLWPSSVDVPMGWKCAFGPERKAQCDAFVEEHWRDMRPKSLKG